MEAHLCHIESALGRTKVCPGELCPFWQDDVCIVAGLRADLKGVPCLPELLLRLRSQLGDARGIDHGFLPPGLR